MRLLVVEDEPGIAAFLRQGLTEEGYAVDVVGDGERAIEFALSAPYDAIILDILLPKKDGFQVCAELRRRGLRTPILMLTARGAVEDRVRGLDTGADDYLMKPFAFAELLARVRALLRRPAVALPTLLQVGDLTLDPVTRRVERAGRPIELTPREFSLLELLMRHPGQVLSRTQIAEHVWNYNFFHQSNVVDVYVRYLRRKIDDGFQPRLIHTVRGAGYKIEAPRQ
ncbi:MAG: response regulator transcription factor [Firmicutes bacterium]|nr:response regulator transcription factor [Bacillota bacterium]